MLLDVALCGFSAFLLFFICIMCEMRVKIAKFAIIYMN